MASWIIPIILATITVILLVVLIVIKKNKNKKQSSEKKAAYDELRGKRSKIETPKESLESLNKLSKEFFMHYLRLRTILTYPEIAELLRKKGESSLADFCECMDFALYSGKEVKKPEVIALINQFIFLTKNKKFRDQKQEKV